MEPPRRLLLGLHIERSLELPNLFRSCPAHANLLTSARWSAPRTRAPFLLRHYPDSSVVWAPATPVGPVPPRGRCSVALTVRTGLPCCKSARVRACCAPYPGEQDDRHMSVHRGVLGGLRLRWGDSALALLLSRPAQALLALR